MTLGTMGFGGGGVFANVGTGDVQDARRQIDLALEDGVNTIDTADIYSTGRAEEIVGEALGSRRDDVILATKARFPMGDGANDAGLSRTISSGPVRPACGGSAPTTSTSTSSTCGRADAARGDARRPRAPRPERQGALRRVFDFAGWQVMKALGIARAERLPVFVSQQVYLSLQERSAEYEIVPSALDQGLGLLIWSPLAGGLLSGKYRRDQPAPEGSRQATDWDEPPVYDEDKLWDTVDALMEVAEEHGVSAAQVALAWLLRRPAVTSLVVGARTEEQLARQPRRASTCS